MAAKQYGGTGNYQVAYINGQWVITNDSEFAAADTINIAYEITSSGPTIISVTDTASGSDAVTNIDRQGETIISVTDSGSIAEAIGPILNTLSVADVGSGAESNPNSAQADVSDTATGSDQITSLSILAQVLDSASSSDMTNASVQIGVADTASGIDIVSPSVAIVIQDSGTITETINNLVPILITDAASGLDSVVASMAAMAVADSASASEALQIASSLSVVDNGSVSEVVALFTDTLKLVMDSASGSDGVANIGVGVIGVNDTATALDAQSIIAALTTSDTASGLDEVGNILKGFYANITDTATASDTVANVVVGVQVEDMASATDLVSNVMASLSVNDSAVGSEVILKFVPSADGTFLVQFMSKAKVFNHTGEVKNYNFTNK